MTVNMVSLPEPNQGRINAHLIGGVQISLGGGGGGVHWCATKGADRAVVYVLGISP
jgi:hypothetical protein